MSLLSRQSQIQLFSKKVSKFTKTILKSAIGDRFTGQTSSKIWENSKRNLCAGVFFVFLLLNLVILGFSIVRQDAVTKTNGYAAKQPEMSLDEEKILQT